MNKNLKILVGIDGSEQSKKALDEAVTIAKCFSGLIKAVAVYRRGMETKNDDIVKKVKQILESAKVDFEIKSILGSNPARALLLVAEQETFDLIVVGSRGLGGTASLLLGSVSRQVVGKAVCNVLVVKKQ